MLDMVRRIEDLERRLRDLERVESFLCGARVYNSANISIPDATLTALTFNSERWDDSGYHSTSTNTGRLTAPLDGRYLIGGNVRWATNATGRRQLRLTLNGATEIGRDTRASAGAAGQTDQAIITYWNCSATDYIEMFVYQDSGGALNVEVADAFSPEFWIMGPL